MSANAAKLVVLCSNDLQRLSQIVVFAFRGGCSGLPSFYAFSTGIGYVVSGTGYPKDV